MLPMLHVLHVLHVLPMLHVLHTLWMIILSNGSLSALLDDGQSDGVLLLVREGDVPALDLQLQQQTFVVVPFDACNRSTWVGPYVPFSSFFMWI